MLVHYKDLFEYDFVTDFAIPAFNIHNLETALAVARAATKKKAPVIMEAAAHTIDYAGIHNLEAIVSAVANSPEIDIPVALHLDHTKDFESIKRAINSGFTSVMIDASHLSYEENIKITHQVVLEAHKYNVWVQAELGRIRGTEDWISVSDTQELFTDPKEAEEFVKKTGVDTLAIAVGTIHGIIKYREKIKPEIDIERIKKINKLVDIPLILHGASGLPVEQVQKAIAAGIRVINIDTDLRIAFSRALRETLKDEDLIDPRKILTPSMVAVQEAAEKKLDEFNTTNQAEKIKELIKEKYA